MLRGFWQEKQYRVVVFVTLVASVNDIGVKTLVVKHNPDCACCLTVSIMNGTSMILMSDSD